jgi:hypothetical protein
VKIKLDENLPATLVEPLAALGHDVDTVPQEAIEYWQRCFVVVTDRKIRIRRGS